MIAVDLDKALLAACQGCNEEFSEEPCEPGDCRIRQKLEDLSATDAVRIIRCWECGHNDKERVLKNGGIWCRYWGIDPDPQDFCSKGERRYE